MLRVERLPVGTSQPEQGEEVTYAQLISRVLHAYEEAWKGTQVVFSEDEAQWQKRFFDLRLKTLLEVSEPALASDIDKMGKLIAALSRSEFPK